jgi:hypothetical protein
MGTPFRLMVSALNPMGIDVILMGYHFKPWFGCQYSWVHPFDSWFQPQTPWGLMSSSWDIILNHGLGVNTHGD